MISYYSYSDVDFVRIFEICYLSSNVDFRVPIASSEKTMLFAKSFPCTPISS